MWYKVKLIKEYIKMADSEEEAIERAKFEFDESNDSSFLQVWDDVKCKKIKYEEDKKHGHYQRIKR